MSEPSIQIASAAMMALGRQVRKTRKPKHTWQVQHRPYVIQPIAIAPVLPNETLTSAMMQARAVSKPVKNPLVGWWLEYFTFYVRLRDLNERDLMTDLMLDPTASLSSLHTAANASTYHYAGSVDYVELCRRRVVQEYFRHEGEAWNVAEGMLGVDPMAKAVPAKSNWLDSAMRDASNPADNNLQNPHGDVQLTAYQAAYDRMRDMRMIDMSFEEWLETFGVSLPKDQAREHVPELLRYHKAWTYPANTVEPTTGAPSSAMSWSIADTIQKDRYFKEPGFICSYVIARPKIYLGNLTGAAVSMLDTAEAWLPPMLRDQAWTSLRKIASTAAGPIAGQGASPANDYWIDLRDLFLYGDQFRNYALGDADSRLDLPAPSLQSEYATSAMMNTLFVADAANYVHQDGVIDLSIKSAPEVATDQT